MRRKSIINLLRKPNIDGTYFCYKDPFLCFCVEHLAGHFSNAKFVHIIRDARDNADSMERSYPTALADEVLTDERLANNNNSEIGIYRAWQHYYLPWWVPENRESEFIGHSQFGRCVWMWREMVTRAASCGQTLGSARYLEIRYEDMVTAPQESAKRISEFLGIADMRRLLKKLNMSRVSSVGINKRRQPQVKIDEANRIAGDVLKRFGYHV